MMMDMFSVNVVAPLMLTKVCIGCQVSSINYLPIIDEFGGIDKGLNVEGGPGGWLTGLKLNWKLPLSARQIEIWKNWLVCWARWWNIQIKANPTQPKYVTSRPALYNFGVPKQENM